MRPERGQQRRNARQEAIVDDSLVLVRLDLELAVLALLVDLALLGADKGPLVDIGVNLNVRVVAELQRVLPACSMSVAGGSWAASGEGRRRTHLL